MKVLLILLVSMVSQISFADTVVVGKDLVPYISGAREALRKSPFSGCFHYLNWNYDEFIEHAYNLVVVDGTSNQPPSLVFSAITTDHRELIKVYLNTDSKYATISSVQLRAYYLQDVNKGTLKNPIIVKEYVLGAACGSP